MANPLELIFTIDSSDQISDDIWYEMLKYIQAVILGQKHASNQFRVSIINFGDTARVELPLEQGTDQEGVLMKLNSITQIRGSQDLVAAFNRVKDIIQSGKVRNNAGKLVVALIGGDVEKKYLAETNRVIDDLRKKDNVKFAIIGIGGSKQNELSEAVGCVTVITDVKELPSTIDKVSKKEGEASG